MEDNHFSDEITQMTIELIRGDDQAVKEYLASRLELSMNIAHDRAELIEQLKIEQNSSQTRLQALDEELQEHRYLLLYVGGCIINYIYSAVIFSHDVAGF